MARILTGIQSTGVPHLGNLLGAIEPAIEMANDAENESYLFIADMHSLTQIKDAEELRQNSATEVIEGIGDRGGQNFGVSWSDNNGLMVYFPNNPLRNNFSDTEKSDIRYLHCEVRPQWQSHVE